MLLGISAECIVAQQTAARASAKLPTRPRPVAVCSLSRPSILSANILVAVNEYNAISTDCTVFQELRRVAEDLAADPQNLKLKAQFDLAESRAIGLLHDRIKNFLRHDKALMKALDEFGDQLKCEVKEIDRRIEVCIQNLKLLEERFGALPEKDQRDFLCNLLFPRRQATVARQNPDLLKLRRQKLKHALSLTNQLAGRMEERFCQAQLDRDFLAAIVGGKFLDDEVCCGRRFMVHHNRVLISGARIADDVDLYETLRDLNVNLDLVRKGYVPSFDRAENRKNAADAEIRRLFEDAIRQDGSTPEIENAPLASPPTSIPQR
jgi:hypothetical protein